MCTRLKTPKCGIGKSPNVSVASYTMQRRIDVCYGDSNGFTIRYGAHVVVDFSNTFRDGIMIYVQISTSKEEKKINAVVKMFSR